jgi:hypothetical protein
MEVNDTKKAFLTKELKIQNENLSAEVNSTEQLSDNINSDTIQFSDQWSKNNNLFTNTKVEKIDNVKLSDLLDIPSGVVYDSVNDTLTFVDESLTKYFGGNCKIEGSDTITLNEIVSDINVFETLDKINNFGDVYDFQFRQIDFSTHPHANVKSFVSFEKIIGYFSIDKLINDELIRKNNQTALFTQYANTDRTAEFPPYSGFLSQSDYLNGGWVSLDQIIRNVYKDDYAYEQQSSTALRTPKILGAKRALITLTLSYVCDFFNLNSFNKLSDFGIRIVDRTTGQELSVSNTKIELIEKIATTLMATYSGKLIEPTEETAIQAAQNIETGGNACKKIKTNKCDGSLFTVSSNQNYEKESGFVHEIDAQVRINPFKQLLTLKPDILNTIDPIHWTTGVNNLSEIGELFSLVKEFGSNTYKSGKLNESRAFAYGSGDFLNGIAVGGYTHTSNDIKTTSSTESWNGIAWSVRENCPLNSACGLTGGNQDIAVIAYGAESNWTENDKTFDNSFKPSTTSLLKQSAVFQNNTWITITDIEPSLPRHSVAGKLNIKYDESVPGENIEQILNKDQFFVCNDAISEAKQFASQKFEFTSETPSVAGELETPNTSPKVWFDIWQCNGISFGGTTSTDFVLDNINAKTQSQSGVTDEFEILSWVLIKKNTLNSSTGQKTVVDETFGCWYIDPIRKYPIKAFGISYVGTNDSGIATGGKTSNSLSNSTLDNVKVNMKNYYFDPEKFNIDNLSVVPYCYENNGISWIRREDLPEAVYYHAGVGNNEYAVFFGGLHASLENPIVYTSFKNCQDWETLIKLYGGSFARNGSYSLDGNIRFSSFSSLYDKDSKGAEDSFGNTYYKNRDPNSPTTSSVTYSDEYLNSGNPTVQQLYPNISDFLEIHDPEFTFKNKQIHAKVYVKLEYSYVVSYYTIDNYKFTFDIVFDRNLVDSFELVQLDPINGKLIIYVTDKNKQELKDYIQTLTDNNVTLENEQYVILTNVFSNGVNRLVSLSDESSSNKSNLNIFEDKLTNSNINNIGKFTYYVVNNSKEFTEQFTKSGDVLPIGVAARKENYFSNLNPKYKGHPSSGGMWLVSRPTVAETFYDPKSFLTEYTSISEIVDHGLSVPISATPYSYFIKPVTSDVYVQTDINVSFSTLNYKLSSLYQFIKSENNNYTFNELWRNPYTINNKLFVNAKKVVSKDGYNSNLTVNVNEFPTVGTKSSGYFVDVTEEKINEFLNDQFIEPEVVLPRSTQQPNRDTIFVQMYDNDTYGFSSFGNFKTSCIRDKAGLWPWCDLLQGDPTNSCKSGDYTFKWDLNGTLYYAEVIESNDTNNTLTKDREEQVKIIKFASNGKKIFEYIIDYKENIDGEELPNTTDISFIGNDTTSYNDFLNNKKQEYGIYNIFGKSIKRQDLLSDKFNSLHVYGSRQNYELTDRTISSYDWVKSCSDEIPVTEINKYPFKFSNLCDIIKTVDVYKENSKFQLYLEGYGFGDTSLEILPKDVQYNTRFIKENTTVKTKVPPQILTQNLCGLRENLLKLRYNLYRLAPHSGLLYGDIRLMGEDVNRCYMRSNCSIVACGDTPQYVPDYDGVKGQPEYYIDRLTNQYKLLWDNTSIGTEFTSNLFARFTRDASGDLEYNQNYLNTIGLTNYPNTYKNGAEFWTPVDIAANPDINDRTLKKKPNVVIFCAGLFDVMYDKNFYETIYFLEEIAKKALQEKIWVIFLTIPPRGMLQYSVAIEKNVWYKNLVGDGRIDGPVDPLRMSVKEYPYQGDEWNTPMTFGPYQGLADPFVGKTKLEKLVAINEWMKETLVKYEHDVLDLYDHFADKQTPASGQSKYKFNVSTKTITNTGEPVYGFIKDDYTNERFVNDEMGQFGGLITNSGNSEMMNLVFNSVDLIPRLSARIINFESGKLINPKTVFDYLYPDLADKVTDSYFDFQKVGVANTYLSSDKLTEYSPDMDTENEKKITLTAGEEDFFEITSYKECYHTFEFDLLCCLLQQDTCYTSCYSSICDALGEQKDNIKYKWIQHNHEEWSTPILESPFAGPFSTEDFNVWLASGDIKNTRWGTNIWSTVEGGIITLHHRSQRLGISDPQAGYELVDGVWTLTNKKSNRRVIYYATIVSEVQIPNIESIEYTKPTACRTFYNEFIFDMDAYSETGIDGILKEIIRISYPSYTGTDLIPLGKEYNTKYESLGLECNDVSTVYEPEESQLNPKVGGEKLCSTETFTYSEWVTSFIQEMKNNVNLRKLVDQKENKYFLKYDINRPFGSTTYKNSQSIVLTPDTKIVDTEWRRYQDGVGLGGDVPLLNVTNDNKLTCNTLNSWFLGQTAFGTPDRAIVFGGFEFFANGVNNASHCWWENLTTDLTFKWNKFVINPEDTFNTNYSRRSLSPLFTNREPTTAKSSMGGIIFDLTNNVMVERQGTAIFDDTNSVEVTLEIPEIIVNKDKYSITLTPSDNINCWYEQKTSSGFTIKVDAESWSGTIDWFITINDKITTEDIEKDNNTPFNTYEEL